MTAQSSLTFRSTKSDHPTPQAEREAIVANPGFGKYFTDHMVSIDWTLEQGWHDAALKPYGPLMLDPASSVLHYAQEIFEGLKAYRHPDGSIWTFRPEENAARMQRSATRLALPPLPTDLFLESIKQLVRADAAWVPMIVNESIILVAKSGPLSSNQKKNPVVTKNFTVSPKNACKSACFRARVPMVQARLITAKL